MTFTRFFGFWFLLWLLLAVLQAVFLNNFNLDAASAKIIFALAVLVITLACCRRLGVINFLEGAMVAIVWTLGLLLANWIILKHVLNLAVFSHFILWVGYLVVALTIFFGHKKRHIQVRKEMEAHHAHGHH